MHACAKPSARAPWSLSLSLDCLVQRQSAPDTSEAMHECQSAYWGQGRTIAHDDKKSATSTKGNGLEPATAFCCLALSPAHLLVTVADGRHLAGRPTGRTTTHAVLTPRCKGAMAPLRRISSTLSRRFTWTFTCQHVDADAGVKQNEQTQISPPPGAQCRLAL